MASDFETPLTPPAAAPVAPVNSGSVPPIPLAPQQSPSPAGTYFGASAYPGPQQFNQSAQNIVNVYPNHAATPPTNGMAIGSLVTGILGMAPVAIPLGIIALNRIQRTGEGGRWQAITGIALGGLQTLTWAMLLVPAVFLTW